MSSSDVSEAEKYLWESLPPELQHMVCEYLPQRAISRRLSVAVSSSWDDKVALFEQYLYKKPYLRMEAGSLERFNGLTTSWSPDRQHHDRLSKFRDMLIHVTPEAGRKCLAIMRNLTALLDLPQHISNLRVVAFTNESRVTAQTEKLFLKFFERQFWYLDVLCIPTWYDGEKVEKNFIWGVLPHLLQQWDFFHPKNEEELESVALHNNAALGDSANSFEFDREIRMPKLLETTGSPMLGVKVRRPFDSRTHEAGKEVEILVNRDAPAHYCRKLLEQKPGREVVSITIDNSRAESLVPLQHIFKGIGWDSMLESLEEFSVTYLDLAEYGNSMISEDEDDFPISAIKSLTIKDCVGIRSFLDGCHAASIAPSSLILKHSLQKLEQDEETALCTLIESCSDLQTLCLIYEKAKPIIEGTTTPSFWEGSISKIDQSDWCNFPLATILPSIGHSLTSLHLGADPSLRLHTKDLAFIATQCTNLASLGIPFPALTEDITPDQFRQEISDLGVLRDLLLLQYLHLACPPAEPDEDGDLPPPVEDIARCALEMLLNKWILTHVKCFTVAFRTATFTRDTCHFRVLSYTNKVERISEKKLGRNMEAFGHFVRGDWDEMCTVQAF
ncbi:hypothetical protein J4E85_004520 [Alternaria conjuncta]|uniref:uncharacterized protein n=1 Tax=Alternaria conjuncta TaxID=181017 RepID=UPI0022208A79|nr:uncharacterized protein J4E85_004520 [Alternaria conjuncta]KAI4929899.1 hypothetical protein J4E85_004520 [Alternaria conjuncta]